MTIIITENGWVDRLKLVMLSWDSSSCNDITIIKHQCLSSSESLCFKILELLVLVSIFLVTIKLLILWISLFIFFLKFHNFSAHSLFNSRFVQIVSINFRLEDLIKLRIVTLWLHKLLWSYCHTWLLTYVFYWRSHV
jgi:hypothetical protein